MTDGAISPAHAQVLAAGTQDLPAQVAADAEPVLVDAARRLDPPRLRQAIAHLRLVADPVFDEVITGFRVARGGAQEALGVRPDLAVLGKVLGGGLPLAAVAGPRGLLEQLAPVGETYQAGTLSGNPLATAAGPRDAARAGRRCLRAARPGHRAARGRPRAGRRGGRGPGAGAARDGTADRVLLRAGP